jgi:hypothetical protein
MAFNSSARPSDPPPRVSGRIRFLIVGLGAVTAAVALLSQSNILDDPVKSRSDHRDFGSAEEAFEISCQVMKAHLADLEFAEVSFDPHFRAVFLSQSKIWTVKGYASCAGTDKSYRWAVILSYYGPKEWEILEKIVTPEITNPETGQIEGAPQSQGKLIPATVN